MSEFTGYLIDLEPKEISYARNKALKFNLNTLMLQSDLPDTRNIKDVMRRDDQGRVGSCTGFGGTHAYEVAYFLMTGKWRQFQPMWTYKKAQPYSGIRGDRGATITGVIKAGLNDGFLPEDFDNDGNPETVYRPNYNMTFPPNSKEIAKPWTFGYHVEVRTFDDILRFLQANQGGVVTGGPWGRWEPNRDGICDRFSGGGGGHARAYVDWIKIDGQTMLVEANSHGDGWGDNGFSYHTKRFCDTQARNSQFVAFGISNLITPEPVRWDYERNPVTR
jgi:hypothetical protein